MYACVYIYRASNASTSRSFLNDVDYSNHQGPGSNLVF